MLSDREESVMTSRILVWPVLGGQYFRQLSGQAVAMAAGGVLDGELRGK